jgi:hypothetical protein
MKTLKQLHNAVLKFEPNEVVGSEEYYAMLFLLTALQVGANLKRCCRFMKIKPYSWEYGKIHKFRNNLHRSGVWKNGKIYADWFDKKTGGVAFIYDVCVCLGTIKRSKNE